MESKDTARRKNYSQKKWDLTDLLDSHEGPSFDQKLEDVEQNVQKFEKIRDTLSPEISSKEFYSAIELSDAIDNDLVRISGRGETDGHGETFGYGELWYCADTSNSEAMTFVARMKDISAGINNRMKFFDQWWKRLDSKNAERLLNGAGKQEYGLRRSREFEKYTLTEPEEKIITLKDNTGRSALLKVYSTLTNGFDYYVTIDGKRKKFTNSELTQLIQGSDAEKRKSACQAQLRPYGKNTNVLGTIYQSLVRDGKNEDIELRGYETPIQVMNKRNDVPDEAVDTLLNVCRENRDVFQKYFKIKAKMLGKEKLSRYDIYAPTGKDTGKKYSFNEAVNLVFDTFKEFSPEMEKFARRVFDDNHIDSEVRPRKRGGAFCEGVVPELAPYVLVNFNEKYGDVSTLAHELGHAIHYQLSGKRNGSTGYDSSLPLAETASMFSEKLLSEKTMKNMSKEERKEKLAKQLDDEYASILRQAYFVQFEKDAHKATAAGATTDDLCNMYMGNLKEQFGDAVDIPKEFRHEWSRVPHIFNTPFYCYAYSFGNLLSTSLYQKYKEEGKEEFVPKYLDFLSKGSAESPDKALKEMGVDMQSKEFWQGGFDYIKGQVRELESLAG